MKKIKTTLSAALAALTVLGCAPVNAIEKSRSVKSTVAVVASASVAAVVTPVLATFIGYKAYDYFKSITVGEVGKSLTSKDFKKYCKKQEVEMHGLLPALGGFSGMKVYETFVAPTTVKIRDGVKSIEKKAFEYCCVPKNIIIPKSVEHIDEDAFDFSSVVSAYPLKITYNGKEFNSRKSFFEAFNKDHPQNAGAVAQ